MVKSTANNAISGGQIILLIAGLVAIMPFAIDVYLPALGAIASDLGSSVHYLEQSVSSFYLGIAAGQIIGAPFSDRYGRRKPVLIGMLIFSITSVIIILSPTAQVMIGWRFVQAFGAGVAAVNAGAIVRDCFDEVGTARAFANIAVVMMIAPLLSPLIGAYLLEWFNWPSIFLFLAMYGLLQLVLLYFKLPETIQLRDRPISAMGYRNVLISHWSNVLAVSLSFSSVAFFLYLTDASFIFLRYYGLSPTQFAWIFTLGVVMLVLAHQSNRVMLAYYKPRRILMAAVPLQCLFSVLLFLYCRFTEPAMWPLYALIMTIASLTQIITSNGLAIFLSLHPDHAGKANAIFGSMRFTVGGIFGFVLANYHSQHPITYATLAASASVFSLILFTLCRMRSDIFSRANTHS